MKIKNILIIFIAIMAMMAKTASGATDSLEVKRAYELYPKYVTFLPKSHIDSVLQYADTDIVPVKFEMYKSHVTANAELDSITLLINSINNDELVTLAYVWVGGSSSPDGSLSLNNRLAEERAQALAEYIKEHTDISDSQIRCENLGEDWNTITKLLCTNRSGYGDEILIVIETENDFDSRELKLKRLDNGRPWQWLKNEILPQLRNARMVIVCSAEQEDIKIEPAPEPEPEPADTIVAAPIVDEAPAQPVEEPTKKWFIAAKTNLLWLAATIANVGVEIQFADKWSLDIPLYYSPYNLSSDRKLRVLATQPEVRYWLGDNAGEGHFFGLHGHLMGFNVAINDHGRYQDSEHPLWGFGLGYGYVINWGENKNWGMEFNVGLGFANYRYDKYYNLPHGQKCGEGEDWYYGLTRAGITLTYKWWVPRKTKVKKGLVE